MNKIPGFIIREEGDKCPDYQCKGVLLVVQGEECNCHIKAPCNNCLNAPAWCPVCKTKWPWIVEAKKE